MEFFRESQMWYVVFDDGRGGSHWWDIFTRRGFRHVKLYRELKPGSVLTVDCLAHVMAVKHFDIDLQKALESIITCGATAVLGYEVTYGSHYRNMPMEPMTCVSAAKRMLGIRRRSVLTPFRLYRELLEAGAQVVKPWSPHVGLANI